MWYAVLGVKCSRGPGGVTPTNERRLTRRIAGSTDWPVVNLLDQRSSASTSNWANIFCGTERFLSRSFTNSKSSRDDDEVEEDADQKGDDDEDQQGFQRYLRGGSLKGTLRELQESTLTLRSVREKWKREKKGSNEVTDVRDSFFPFEREKIGWERSSGGRRIPEFLLFCLQLLRFSFSFSFWAFLWLTEAKKLQVEVDLRSQVRVFCNINEKVEEEEIRKFCFNPLGEEQKLSLDFYEQFWLGMYTQARPFEGSIRRIHWASEVKF